MGTSRVPLALFDGAPAASADGAVRVLPGARLTPLSPDPARVPPLPDADPPPRVTAPPPLLPPLGPDERGVAFCPLSSAANPLAPLKPARCCGAFSRIPRSPKLIDGDDDAPADGEL